MNALIPQFPRTPQDLLFQVLFLIPLILSLTVHEFAHAWSAWRLGDDTAARAGRLTLNPVPHIDPLGTLLLPLLGIPFGWAKPVPVNPARFSRKVSMGFGMMLTAAAGPLSNLVLALLSTITYVALFTWSSPEFVLSHLGIIALLQKVIVLNVALALFNMIPVPPLDGSRVLDYLMPAGWRPGWERVGAIAPLLLLPVMLFGGRFIVGPARFVTELLVRVAKAMVS